MSCRIPYDKLQSLFTRSLAYDRATYRFYRNYIKSVINMPIRDEAKVHAIWFGGLSYNDALNYEADIVTEGLPTAISNLVYTSLNSDTADFSELLNGIKDILEGKESITQQAPVSTDAKADIEKLKQTPEGKQIEEEKQKTIRSVRMVKDMLGAAVYEFEVRGKKESIIGDHNTLYSYINNIYNTELTALEGTPTEKNTLKAKYIGKLIYATPGAGKTTLSQSVDNIMDTDVMMIEEMKRRHPDFTMEAGETPQQFIFRYVKTHDHKGSINATILQQARELTQNGVTVVTGTMAFIKDADVVVVTPSTNPRVQSRFGSAQIAEEFSQREAEEIQKHSKTPVVIQTNLENLLLESMSDVPEGKSIVDLLNATLKKLRASSTDNILSIFQEYASLLDDAVELTNAQKLNNYDKFLEILSSKPDSINRGIIATVIQTRKSELNKEQLPTGLVDFGRIPGIGLDMFSIRIHSTGEVIEAINIDGRYYKMNPAYDGSNPDVLEAYDVQPLDYVSAFYSQRTNTSVSDAPGKNARIYRTVIDNGIFFEDVRLLPLGVVAKKPLANRTGNKKISDKLTPGLSAGEQVQIIADRRRVRINRERLENLKSKGYDVRYENNLHPNQINYLTNNPDGVVVSFLKPKVGFDLIISDMQGVDWDYISGLDTLGFVFADGTTRLVDWNSESDLELLGRTLTFPRTIYNADKSSKTIYEYVTPADINAMSQAVAKLRDFRNEIAELMGDQEVMVVPNDLVNEYYNIANTISAIPLIKTDKEGRIIEKATTPLADIIPQLVPTGSTIKATIAKTRFGRVVPDDVQTIDLVGIVKKNTATNTLEFVPSIPDGYVIVDDNLNQIRNPYETLFGAAGLSLEKLARITDRFGYGFFYVANIQDKWSVRPMQYNAPMSEIPEIVNFASVLSALVDNRPAYSPEPESKALLVQMIQDFNNNGWGFNVQYGISPNVDYLRMWNSEPVYGIRLRAQPDYPLADKFNEKDIKLEFSFDYRDIERYLNTLYKELGIDKPVFKSVAERIEFGEKLEATLKQAIATGTLSLRAQQAYENIVNNYKEARINLFNQLENVIEQHGKDVAKGEEPYIDDNAKLIYALFQNLDGTDLKLRSNTKSPNPIDRFKTFEKDFKRKAGKNLSIVNAKPRVSTGATIKVNTPPPSGVTPTPVEPAAAPAKQVKVTKRRVFSIVDSLKGLRIVSDEAVKAEIDEMRAKLGDNLKDVIETDLTDEDVNGTALGYAENGVITLNKNLRVGGIVYHEAFHIVFRMSFTNEQRRQYLDTVAKITGGIKSDAGGKYINLRGKKVYLNKFRLDRRYSGVADEIIADYIYEEYMADGFRDYKLNNKQPKNALLKFLYRLMDTIVNFFTGKGYKKAKESLRELYQDIDTGKYASVVGDIYIAPRAYELINVPSSIKEDETLGYSAVDTKTHNQLVDRITSELLTRSKDIIPNDSESFDKVYDEVTSELIKYFNIRNFIAEDDPRFQEAVDKYEPIWRSMRYMMGSLHRPDFNEAFALVNKSADSGFDNFLLNQAEGALDESFSVYETIKDEVAKLYRSVGISQDVTDEDSENERNESEDNADEDYQQSNDESEVGERYDDEGITSFKPYDGTSEFQKILRFVKYEVEDPDLGFSYIKMVDSRNVINIIRKITANVPKQNIVQALLNEIELMRLRIQNIETAGVLDELTYIPTSYVNLVDQYNTLRAVYNTLSEQAGLNEDLRATRKSGEGFFNMFHDVFYYAQKDVVAVTVNTNWEGDVSSEVRAEGRSPIRNNYTVKNLIQNNDISIVTRNFREMVEFMVNNMQTIPYRELLEDLNAFNYETPLNAAEFVDVVNTIYKLTAVGKLDIPYNVIEFSVAADVKLDRGNRSSFVDIIIERDRKLYDNDKYFDVRDFLTAYRNLIANYNKTGIDSKIDKLVDVYRPVAPYQIKYEPGLSGTIVLNQDGKPISQFVPYVPSIQILSDIKRMGFEQAMNSIYGSTAWFTDNPWLNIGIADTAFDATRTDKLAKRQDSIRTFLNAMDITIAGGLYQEFEGTQLKSTFRRLGDKGYTLSVLGMFANRFKVKNNYNEDVTLFNRPITQLEATSTQFNVTGLYNNYNAKGNDVTIINQFKAILKQEFNRIQREWSTKDDPTKKLLDKYNSFTLPDGTVITDDTTSEQKLRAYTFNYLGDFFTFNENTERLRGILIDAAKEGKTFEETLALFPEESEILNTELLEYGERSVQEFRDYLTSIDIDNDDLPSSISTGKLKEEKTYLTEYQTVQDEGRETKERVESATKRNKDAFVRDFVYNYWFNGFFINQLFDGDLAVGIKGFIDYFKRQKSGVAAGTNYENVNIDEANDVTTTAVLKSFEGYLDPEDGTVPVSTTATSGKVVKMSDGQAWTTLMRRIKKYRKDGILSPRLEALLLKMRHTALNPNELQELVDNDLTLSSGKPVAAHPYFYLKDSEHIINRTDVSFVTNRAEVARLYAILDGIDFSNYGLEDDPESLYEATIREIHSYFVPKKGREFGHHLLNSMEFHRIDVVFDQEVTKKASMAPLIINSGLLDQGILEGHPVMTRPGMETGINSVEDGYINLSYSKQDIPNRFFYDQVGTKGIKSETTDAIQKKLLTPAQLDPKEFPLVKAIAEKQNSIATARLAYLQRLFKTNNPSTLIAKAIQDGLLNQGAGDNLLKYYKINEEGKNEFNLNLPILGKTPLYYYFSVFNNNLFGPKVAGKKFFHVSNLGYKIVVDENDNPVPRNLLDAFPDAYQNYNTRYPTVKEEYNADGELTRIVVEVIVPRELVSNPDDVEFFEALYTEFLAARIPTEDKRSLLVAKVVDTIDGSYGNSIIVPSQVHVWAGSDLDIDALYADTYDYYRTVRGELVKYGDYETYRKNYGLTDAEARFVEYLHFIAEDPSMRGKVDAEIEKQVSVLGHRFLSIKDMAGEFGPKLASFFENTRPPELQRMNIQLTINELRNEQSAYNRENKLLRTAIKESSIAEEKQILRDQIRKNDQEILGLIFRIDSLNNLIENRYSWEEIKKSNDLNTLMTRMVSVINVLKDNGLPATLAEFNAFVRENGNPVTPVLQNEILDDKMNLLADPRVYERFVKSADAEVYLNAYKTDKNLVSDISEFKGVDKSNPFLFQTVAKVRSLNNGAKDMLGANASQNKGAALLASSKTALGDLYVHSFVYNGKKVKTSVPVDNAVQLVGGAIGVSADDGKNQYLGPLRLSRYNSAVVNALYIYGYPPQFARLLSSVDLIANAITKFRLNDDPSYSRSRGFRMSFGRSLANDLGAILTSGQPYQKELASKGLLKANPDKKDLYDVDLSKVTIEFRDVAGEPVSGNKPSNFNITVKYGKDNVLDDRLASVVLMAFYSNMLEVGNVISFKVSTITNVYKKIKPDFQSLSKIKDAAKYLNNDNPVFKNSKKIFKDNPGLTMLVEDGIDMMNDISKQVLMDQTDLFRAITNMFKYDKNQSTEEVVTQLKSILGFSALNKYVEKRVSEMDMDNLSREDRFLLLLNNAFTLNEQGEPAFWSNNQAIADLKFLKSRYPDNMFLQALTEKPAVYGGKTNMNVITSIIGNKVNPERQDNIVNDFYQLILEDDLSVYESTVRVALHGMLKDAGISKRESYLKLIAPELFNFLSDRLDKLQEGLYKVDTTSRNKLETYLGGLDELFREIYNLPKDPKLERGVDSQRVLQSILTKLVSTVTQNLQGNKSLSMSFFPGGTMGGKEISAGKFSDIRLSTFKRIIDTILPKNKQLVYFYDGKTLTPNNDLTYTPGSGIKASKTRFELWKADKNGEIYFDLSDIPAELSLEVNKILKAQGMYPVKGQYAFPLYQINNFEGGQMFILQEIDGKPFNTEFFKNLFEAYKNNEEFEYLLRGKTAKYVMVQKQGVDRISPNAFTNKVAAQIKNKAEKTRVTRAERKLGVLPLPANVTLRTNSSHAVVASKELADELTAGTWKQEGMIYTMTSPIRYATVSGAIHKGKLYVQGKPATDAQKDEFANKIGFANFTAALADPKMNSWLNPTKASNQMWVIPYTVEAAIGGEIVDVSRPVVAPAQPSTQPTEVKGFQGYKGGFEDKGKGTPEGDGKDKAMREVADGFIGEIVNKKSSSYTSAQSIGKKTKQGVTPEEGSYTINAGNIEKGSVIMLARNGKFNNRPLEGSTKRDIADANMYGAEFIVGDMPGVDSQFIDYLQEIGAKFTIYHTGSTPRIQVKQPTTQPTTQPSIQTTNDWQNIDNDSENPLECYGEDM